LLLAGALIGALTGLFGVGGSSIATPILSVLGVPPIVAVATPLPSTVPSAGAAVIPYLGAHEARAKAALFTIAGAMPGAILGAWASKWVGGNWLLILSGVVLIFIGQRVLRPIDAVMRGRGAARRRNRVVLVGVSGCIGLFSGLLANGGGFLLVPAYLLLFGLRMREASGTSLLVVIVLAVPIIVVHSSLGHVDWPIAGALALGSVPAAFVAGRYAHMVEGPRVRRSFGWFLQIAGVAFVAYRLLGAS
jgi:uncharacterized protein